ncbi:DUF396-domain-containing protein [Gonapodya prolifera JEL478]|uniref:DUF396-domain-containing protein n=1 Tax=Gonapodya prolifera (strain JEL478) TaxID=1344416 RepID=A0A138ZYS2_GONPJ|nr:DUF396-domain-containing protein [Gonapodya prolifera JEL478]|eukprot:KXS09640.1 DUF396-domain-containing protein [Gonapodya prolifera JEL478]
MEYDYRGRSSPQYYSQQYEARYGSGSQTGMSNSWGQWGLVSLTSYVGTAGGFAFLTLSLACGLYYLAELVEEYTVLAKKVIKWSLIIVTFLHPFLWLIDSLPLTRVLFSLACHIVYWQLLPSFPIVRLTSWLFLLSCALAVINHFMWFSFFARNYHTFPQVASFFAIYVWLVPFEFFISLSANENVLPNYDNSRPPSQSSLFSTRSSTDSTSFDATQHISPPRKKSRNLIRWLVESVWKGRGEVLPSARTSGSKSL